MSEITRVCENYFNCAQNFQSDRTDSLGNCGDWFVGAAKIASYCLVIFPLIFGILWGGALLTEWIWPSETRSIGQTGAASSENPAVKRIAEIFASSVNHNEVVTYQTYSVRVIRNIETITFAVNRITILKPGCYLLFNKTFSESARRDLFNLICAAKARIPCPSSDNLTITFNDKPSFYDALAFFNQPQCLPSTSVDIATSIAATNTQNQKNLLDKIAEIYASDIKRNEIVAYVDGANTYSLRVMRNLDPIKLAGQTFGAGCHVFPDKAMSDVEVDRLSRLIIAPQPPPVLILSIHYSPMAKTSTGTINLFEALASF